MDLRQNVLSIGQEKIQFSVAEIIVSTNHSIKQLMGAEKGDNRCGEEESLCLGMETEELINEGSIGKTYNGHQGKALACS